MEALSTRFTGSTYTELALKYLKDEDKILDCGSIYGEFLTTLDSYGYKNLYSVDFKNNLRYGNIKNSELDLNKDSFPYSNFDLITAWGLVEHLENPYHFMREVHKSLKPDGLFIMAIPNVFHIISRLIFLKRGFFPRWDYKNNHIFILPHGILEKTFGKHFQITEEIYYKPSLKPYLHSYFNKFLPANQWTGEYVAYVMKKK